jgi:sialidase-1
MCWRTIPIWFFIEFCVNDFDTADKAPLRTRRSMEGIVRQIRRHNPQTAIVLFATVGDSHLPFYERGELPPSVAAHDAIARHYDLPFVHGGRDLWQKVVGGVPWGR